jgi:hypothetical protein
VIEAEEKATKALDQLNLSGNLFDQPRENTAQVDSNKTSQDVITEKVEDAEEDHQMSIASGEYDKQEEMETK